MGPLPALDLTTSLQIGGTLLSAKKPPHTQNLVLILVGSTMRRINNEINMGLSTLYHLGLPVNNGQRMLLHRTLTR